MPGQFKILIAEDDDNDYLMITTAIGGADFPVEITRANNGLELTDMIVQDHIEYIPDIIILDINMPLKDGFDVIRELKSNEKLKIIPIIVLSTSNYDVDIYMAYSLGANCYITKPDNFKKLIEIMESINDFWNNKVKLSNYWLKCEGGTE